MALIIRAVYEEGVLRLLDPVDIPEGQQLKISIEPVAPENALRAALGDMIVWSNTSDDTDAWIEAEADTLAKEYNGSRPLSELIIEERDNGW